MEWKVIRAAFIRARGARKQDAIAKAGGLYQSHISKLETNDKLGPAVEVFVKAIEGLGMTPSQFFLQIERQTKADYSGGVKLDKDQATLHPGVADDVGDLVSTTDSAQFFRLGEALINAGLAFHSAARGLPAERAPEPLSQPRPAKPGRGKRRAGDR